MRFGIFDHVDRNATVSLGAFYEDRLVLAEEYDRAGFYGYHVAEHHATPLGLSPSPSVYLSAVAQRTRRLRFGPLVYTLPQYHPVRLIDEVCMLDQMSNGRMMLGVGRGISPIELRMWGLDPEQVPAMYAEALEVLLRGLRDATLTFEGRFYSFRDYPMLLRPAQAPHPPLWYGLVREATIPWAVANAVNVVTNLPPEGTRRLTDAYRAAWRAAGKPDDTMPLMGFGRHLVLAATEREAYDIARRGYGRWRDSFLKLWLEHDMQPPGHANFPQTFEEAEARGRAVAGPPAKVAAVLRGEVASGGVNYLLCRFAFGDIGRDEALQSVRLFTSEVMPALS